MNLHTVCLMPMFGRPHGKRQSIARVLWRLSPGSSDRQCSLTSNVFEELCQCSAMLNQRQCIGETVQPDLLVGKGLAKEVSMLSWAVLP